MRAAAFTAAALIAIGVYLMIASALRLGPTWMALGVLAIAVTMAVSLVSAEQRAASSH
jgi:multisubunit Na+/H+ antiporter MnhC subunit